jgi:amidase
MVMSFSEYDSYDALGLAELVRKGEVTARELVDAAIDRIERYNGRINAVIHPLFERARERAEGELPDGPFRGVPFLIKDLLSALAGEPLQQGSRMYTGWRPRESSELVNRYLASGTVIVGKTNTPELGLLPTTEPQVAGPSRNPWNTDRTTGGSSGGSAAAIAARIVPMAGGGDGGGSIRIPSSCCGLFGLKPTRGRTPTGPMEAEGWDGFAIEHVLTRSVRDSATMLDAVAGWYPGDMGYMPAPETPFADAVGRDPGKLRIAMSTEPYLTSDPHPDVIAAVHDAAALLRELGHDVVDDAPRVDGRAFGRAFVTVIAGQTASALRTAEDRVGRKATADDFELKTRLAAAAGNAFSAGDYVQAIGVLHAEARKVHQFMADYDLILNPTVSQPPPKLGFLESQGILARAEKLAASLPLGKLLTLGPLVDQIAADAYSFIPWTPIYNVTGQPSMSVPLYWNPEGLPVGVMLTGRFAADDLMLQVAGQLERARPWADRKPPLLGGRS